MPFYRRGFLYLRRNCAKTALLFLVFLFVSGMILGTTMLLEAAEATEVSMREKTKASVICEASDTAHPVTEQEAESIRSLEAVTSVNRMGQQAAYAVSLTPVTASDSGEPENRQVSLYAYDDLESEGPFAEQSFRLTEGSLIDAQTRRGVLVNAGFADANGLSVGDTISLEAEDGNVVTVEVTGVYLAGNESRQENDTPALYRLENRIYIDSTTYLELTGGGFYQVTVCTGQPELLDTLAEEIEEILQGKAEITTSDVLYRQMKAPLTQMTGMVGLMRILAFLTGITVVSLLLCMWMRGRKKEMAVFLSMGERKLFIFLQAFLESAAVFAAALCTACILGNLAAGKLQAFLMTFAKTEVSAQISVRTADIALLAGSGILVVLAAVLLSVLPVLKTNPKDILSEMEE